MDPAKQFFLLFLLFLISSVQIQAREIKFFNRVSHYTTNNNKNNSNNGKETELPKKEETPSKEDEEPSFTPESENGYGLYGHGSGQLPPTTDNDAYYTTGNLRAEKTTTSEYNNGGNYEYKQFNKRYPNNFYSTNNGYETKQQVGLEGTRFTSTEYLNNNNNGYETKQQQTMGGARLADTSYLNNNNNYHYSNNNNKYRNNGYATEQQGMSDTRFLEGGKYFYDMKKESSYPSGYGWQKGSSEGLGSSRNTYNYGGYNGNNNENGFEYNNSMEGYQNQEDQYQESQEEYEP
ncbi:PREDICTED: protein E6 [Nelumbo nucifera]|uniref:Protein E6 n=1 Tax=Nelumbo nucifera TaxID=4432 RepID=A0A1U8A0C3_NELNU|nr:PREDICTED: protein E6 [Nelumbo nucifera]